MAPRNTSKQHPQLLPCPHSSSLTGRISSSEYSPDVLALFAELEAVRSANARERTSSKRNAWLCFWDWMVNGG